MKPISTSEFHARQQALAENLHALGAVAYIAEPGPNALYFANLSLSQWWLSERPFLLMITPLVRESQSGNETMPFIAPHVSIITPQFESSRARLLQVPTSGNVSFVEWAESENPYEAVLSVLQKARQAPERRRIFVDEDIRYFLVDGLKHTAPDFTLESSPAQIRSLRERKSQAELSLLRCANEVRDFPFESEIIS
jgi:Xaa-Pro aminopeptidase